MTCSEGSDSTCPLFHFGDKPFSRPAVTKHQFKARGDAQYTSSLFSGHSFRRGAVTWAPSIGLSPVDIKTLGRWNSDCYKLYVDAGPEHSAMIGRRLLITSKSSLPSSDSLHPATYGVRPYSSSYGQPYSRTLRQPLQADALPLMVAGLDMQIYDPKKRDGQNEEVPFYRSGIGLLIILFAHRWGAIAVRLRVSDGHMRSRFSEIWGSAGGQWAGLSTSAIR